LLFHFELPARRESVCISDPTVHDAFGRSSQRLDCVGDVEELSEVT